MERTLFYILSAIAVCSALKMVLSKNPVHSILYLVAVFFALSGHYILMNAQFIAITNIIVYAGAIMVLFLFVVMLMNLGPENKSKKSLPLLVSGYTVGVALLVICLALTHRPQNAIQVPIETGSAPIGLAQSLGKVLFNDYVFPFELTSILFLTAVLSGVILARKAQKESTK